MSSTGPTVAQAASAPSGAAANTTTQQEYDKKRLYVRWEVTEETLKAEFEKFGKVNEARVVRGPRLRAFGFVNFDTEEGAAKAKKEMEGKLLATTPLHIEYAAIEKAGGRGADGKRPPREPREPREKRPPRAAKDGKDGGAAGKDGKSAPAADGKTTADGKQARRPRQPRAAAAGGGAAGGAGATGGAAGATAGAAAAGAANGARAPRQRQRKPRRTASQNFAAMEAKDPNYGKMVRLVPDPVATPLAKDATVTELHAGPRNYRRSGTGADAKQLASLVLKTDSSKGPFNCNFTLGGFELKLLSVHVQSRPGDTRVGCRVMHPASDRSREVYFRHRSNGQHAHKFLELRHPVDEKDESDTQEIFFVTIDSIALDVNTGLWNKLMLSLVSLTVPKRQRL